MVDIILAVVFLYLNREDIIWDGSVDWGFWDGNKMETD